jgi:hypothetical protein
MAAEISHQYLLWRLNFINNNADTPRFLIVETRPLVGKLTRNELQATRRIVELFRLAQQIAHQNLWYSIRTGTTVNDVDCVNPQSLAGGDAVVFARRNDHIGCDQSEGNWQTNFKGRSVAGIARYAQLSPDLLDRSFDYIEANPPPRDI